MKITPLGLKKSAMRKKVSYEWDIETVDESGEIQDHTSAKRLNEFPLEAIQAAVKTGNLALIRNAWIDYGGGYVELDDKTWAYANESGLALEFDNGIKVPQGYLSEFKAIVGK